jgi:16S rRNA (guanine527-N7)-methyltransferase
MEWHELPGLFPMFGEPERWLPILERHAALIEGAAPRVRVSSVEATDAIRRHYAESLELWRIALEGHGGGIARVADVGSGGGFPGIVIAAVAPHLEVHLIEPLQKRATLLVELVEALGLEHVSVHAIRGEDAGRGPLRDACDVAIARAVGEARELVEYLAALVAPGGIALMPKGSRGADELAAADHAFVEMACTLEGVVPMREAVSETLSVAVLRKTAATPGRYPRRPGVLQKRPL